MTEFLETYRRSLRNLTENARTELDPEGWSSTTVERPGMWAGANAPRAYFTAGLYVSEATPQLFPKMDTFYVPRGSRQLVRPYVRMPQGVPVSDYRMGVELPAALRYVAVDPLGSGATPAVKRAAESRADDVPMARYELSYDAPPGQGMELSIRWGDETGHTLTYQPAVGTGGTFGWRHMSAAVTAPPGAASAHPLITKWQDRGVTGNLTAMLGRW